VNNDENHNNKRSVEYTLLTENTVWYRITRVNRMFMELKGDIKTSDILVDA